MESDGPNMQADLLAELERQLAAANARVEELQAIHNRWYNAAMKHYPLNWAVDPGNPELVIGNIVQNIEEGHRALLAEAHKTLAACREAGLLTVDGVLVAKPTEVWWNDGGKIRGGAAACNVEIMFLEDADRDIYVYPKGGLSECYSTREAAEAARGGGGHGPTLG
jgi:hypothetical protein